MLRHHRAAAPAQFGQHRRRCVAQRGRQRAGLLHVDEHTVLHDLALVVVLRAHHRQAHGHGLDVDDAEGLEQGAQHEDIGRGIGLRQVGMAHLGEYDALAHQLPAQGLDGGRVGRLLAHDGQPGAGQGGDLADDMVHALVPVADAAHAEHQACIGRDAMAGAKVGGDAGPEALHVHPVRNHERLAACAARQVVGGVLLHEVTTRQVARRDGPAVGKHDLGWALEQMPVVEEHVAHLLLQAVQHVVAALQQRQQRGVGEGLALDAHLFLLALRGSPLGRHGHMDVLQLRRVARHVGHHHFAR